MIRLKGKEIKNALVQLGLGISELLFPQHHLCPVCFRKESLHRGLCKDCIQRITLITPQFVNSVDVYYGEHKFQLNAAINVMMPGIFLVRLEQWHFMMARCGNI